MCQPVEPIVYMSYKALHWHQPLEPTGTVKYCPAVALKCFFKEHGGRYLRVTHPADVLKRWLPAAQVQLDPSESAVDPRGIVGSLCTEDSCFGMGALVRGNGGRNGVDC